MFALALGPRVVTGPIVHGTTAEVNGLFCFRPAAWVDGRYLADEAHFVVALAGSHRCVGSVLERIRSRERMRAQR